jgi:catechol 2,3-dioxygenase-like lactoylglutathione lyase family enzyme
MLKDTKAFASFSVDDLQKAKEFYSQTLGLDISEVQGGLLNLQLASGAEIMIYPKPNHTPADFTILTFPVDNIEGSVDALAERGVHFDRYDFFHDTHMHTDEKGISRGLGGTLAWFKDPAGNILALFDATF